MALAGGGAGNGIVMAGKVTAADASIENVKFDRVGASFGGPLRSVAVNSISAVGPWGAFEGHGGFSSQRFVAYGTYRGTFEGLQPLLGTAIVGRGGVAGAVGIGIEPQRILVQGSNLALRGATLRGIPISRASLTLGIEGNRLRIYSAQANAAGGDVVAAGTFALGPGAGATADAVALVAKRLKAPQLRGIGLPLESGTLSATGELSAGTPIPTFDGGVAIDDGRMDRFPLTGNGDVHVSGNAVALHRILGAFGSTYTYVDGSIGALTSGSPAYALDAQVPAAQIAPALQTFGLPNYMTDGTFNARLHIAGRSIEPNVSGYGWSSRRPGERVILHQRKRGARRRSARRRDARRLGARRHDRDALHGRRSTAREPYRRPRAACRSLRLQQLLRYRRYAGRRRKPEARGRRARRTGLVKR